MSGASALSNEAFVLSIATWMVHPVDLDLSQVVAMQTTAPHYLLLTEAEDHADATQGGRWRFVLESMQRDDDRVEVSEREANVNGERLQLLAVVRGVEALEQPSKLDTDYQQQVRRQANSTWLRRVGRKRLALGELWRFSKPSKTLICGKGFMLQH